MEASGVVDLALWEAIRYCGQKKSRLAKLIGVPVKRIYYWLNEAQQIQFQYAIAIERATKGSVSRYDLAPYARELQGKNPPETVEAPVKFREKIIHAMQYERQLDRRKGMRTDLQPVKNFIQVKGKTQNLVAKACGFGSGTNYIKAKYVFEHAPFVLVQAIEAGRFSVNFAYRVAQLPIKQQTTLAVLDKKEAIRQYNLLKENSGSANQTPVEHSILYWLQKVFQDPRLIHAEQQQQVPFRLLLVALLAIQLATGKLLSTCASLKKLFEQEVTLPLCEIIDFLQTLGWVKEYPDSHKIEFSYFTFLGGHSS